LEFKNEVVGFVPEIVAAIGKALKEVFGKRNIIDIFYRIALPICK
jgi:hypothetical protein